MLLAGEVIHADETRTQVLHEEGLLKELSAEERYEQRLAKVKPLLDEFFAWLESLQVSGKSKLAEVVRFLTELFSKPAGTILLPFDT